MQLRVCVLGWAIAGALIVLLPHTRAWAQPAPDPLQKDELDSSELSPEETAYCAGALHTPETFLDASDSCLLRRQTLLQARARELNAEGRRARYRRRQRAGITLTALGGATAVAGILLLMSSIGQSPESSSDFQIAGFSALGTGAGLGLLGCTLMLVAGLGHLHRSEIQELKREIGTIKQRRNQLKRTQLSFGEAGLRLVF